MLTEEFVNTCCAILLSDNKSIPSNIISEINEIVIAVDENSIPLLFRKKFQFLKTITQLKVQDPRSDKSLLVDSILGSGYFKDIESYISAISDRKLSDEQISKITDVINKRKTMISISKNGQEIENFLNKFKNNDFQNIDSLVSQWDGIISGIHREIIDKKRSRELQDITELDLLNDPYEPVLNSIELNYSGKNSISTGYPTLDKYTNGGLAPGRLYIFAATSGGGKSVMLINLIKNAVENNKMEDGVINTYVYVTLENLIDETMVRLYCCLTKQKTKVILDNYATEKRNIERTIKTWLIKHRCNIKFVYKNPTRTSTFDILGYCENLKNQDNNVRISGVYIDYLDLLKPSGARSYEAYRFELGAVTMDMKVMAVLLRCPITSASQLNRQGYDVSAKLSLANIGESMKKVDNADFVGLFQKKDIEKEKTGSQLFSNDDGELVLIIGKNRSGAKDVSITFKTDFSKFLIEEAPEATGLDIDTDLIDLDKRSIVDRIEEIEDGNTNENQFGFL